ncbi:MAG TPA: CoA transferase [Gemmatimonadaceae bacterium]|jgi:crotonobetainyl-CoA:carnitine CoA-transferase CaiB-like acyl-CoA transferase|nr:CoA transferase [Gemmatimonadaceae bacterium]
MLSGIKVLDLTRVLAGPLCTMLLGDLGADVIKVEKPGSGDESRTWGPPFDAEGRSAYYLSINRNKLGLAADLNQDAGREDVERLLAEADVVVDNFLPGVLDRRGLGAAEWCERRPELIWCTVTGFGPGTRRPGYDFVAQAESGWMAITGEPDGDPMKAGVALADVLAGKDATIAVLAALVRRGMTGKGARLSISLIDSARAALVNVAQNSLVTGHEARRWGNAHANLVPYQMFRAADRPIVIAVGSDAQWVGCARALGLDRFADDPSMSTNAGRLRQRERIVAAFAEQLATQPAAHWGRRLDRAGVPNGVVRTVLESLRDTNASALTGVSPSVPGRVRYPPPALGEHSGIIRRFGWDVFKNVTPLPADGASS